MALFTSYSQNFEDVMLWRALKNIQNGFYIDIGAACHEVYSVTKSFYEKGWNGINVEPNSDYFENLTTNRPLDLNLQMVISDNDLPLDFYLIRDTGLSTLNKEIAEQHRSKGYSIELITIQSMTLEQLFELYANNREVHFLKIDVEGAEELVVKGNNWKKHRPWIVVLEATTPMSTIENFSSWESILLENNYLFVYSDGLNRFYVSKEHSDLTPAFKYPPNCFDLFKWNPQGNEYVISIENKLIKIEAKAKKLEENLIKVQEKAQEKIAQYKIKIKELESQLKQIKRSFIWKIAAPYHYLNKIFFDYFARNKNVKNQQEKYEGKEP